MTTNIRFTRMSGPYRTNEVAGFEDDHAQKIIASGAAVLCAENPHPRTVMVGGIAVERLDRAQPPPSSSAVGLTEASAAARRIADDAAKEKQPVQPRAARGRQSLGDQARAAAQVPSGAQPPQQPTGVTP